MQTRASSRIRHLLLVWIWIGLTLCGSRQANGQGNEHQIRLREEVHKLCARSIDDAFGRIRPLIEDEYPDIASRRDLLVFAPYGEFNALAIYQTKRVVITWGYCDQLFLFLHGVLTAELYPESRGSLNSYLGYLAERTLAIERTAPRGRMHEAEVLNFPLFAGIDVRRITDKQAAITWQTIEASMPNALAFAIAHEIGHLALGHRPYTQISSRAAHRQEFAADRFAAKIMTSLIGDEFDPTFSATLMLLLAREAQASGSPSLTHPPTYCRLGQTMLDIGVLSRIRDDQELSRQYEERTGYSPREAIRLLREMRDQCR